MAARLWSFIHKRCEEFGSITNLLHLSSKAAVFAFDERIVSVPERVAQGHHVGLFEVHQDIVVGMAGTEMLHLYGLARKVKFFSLSTMRDP
jgi:hypothetical protein